MRDPASRFLLVNQRYREIFDVDADRDIAGTHIAEVIDPELAETAERFDRRALESGEVVDREVRNELGGRSRAFHLRIQPVYDDGEPFGTCGIATDITERVERARDLERYRRVLDVLPVTLPCTMGSSGVSTWTRHSSNMQRSRRHRCSTGRWRMFCPPIRQTKRRPGRRRWNGWSPTIGRRPA